MGTGTSQAKGSDLLWYWWSALQHRMLPPFPLQQESSPRAGEKQLTGCCTWALLD